MVNSVDYRDTGIILKVTPRVNSSGAVLLDLVQEVSEVEAATITAAIQGPTFSDRKLRAVPGMTDALYAAIAPAASVAVRDAAFEPRTASPLALEVMTEAAPGSPEVIERRRELDGETTALDAGPPLALAGRPLTLRVEARDARGDTVRRAVVVELTRAPARPYVVRQLAPEL